MFAGLQGWHLVIILAVILLLFGAPKLPQLARSVGQSMRIFKSEVKTMKEEDTTEAKSTGIDGTGIAGTSTTTGTGTGTSASSTTPESPTK